MSDKKLAVDSDGNGLVDYYNADVISAQDYYPFGQLMPSRQYGTKGRYLFNGKEQDPEAKGTGAQYDYGFRIYDPRLGKFLSRDPLSKNYPWYTPYQFAGNKPTIAIDIDGKEEWIKTIIDFATFGGVLLAKMTNSTYTLTVGYDVQAGAMVGGATSKSSIGVAIDPNGNIGLFSTSISFLDLFAVMGGVSAGSADQKNPEKWQFLAGAGASLEVGVGVNFFDNIEYLSGTSKVFEGGGDVGVLGAEVAVGYSEDGSKTQSVDVSATFGPGTPFDISLTNPTTKLLGVTSSDLNQLGNVFAEAMVVSIENSKILQLRPTGSMSSVYPQVRQEQSKDGGTNFLIEIMRKNEDGSKETLFSKVGLTTYSKDDNYMRTKAVQKTENATKTEPGF